MSLPQTSPLRSTGRKRNSPPGVTSDQGDIAVVNRGPPIQKPNERWHDDGLLGRSPFNLVVATNDDDSAVGWVNWRDTAREGPGSWEIGIVIVPDMRGRGAGSSAQSQLVDYLFATTVTHRIWAGTEVENVAEQRALERCGFRREGVLRGHHFRDGEWRDSYVYGIIRPDNPDRPRP